MGLLDSIDRALHGVPEEVIAPVIAVKRNLIAESEAVASKPKTIEVMSTAFHHGKTMRKAFTIDGHSLLPDIHWKNVPMTTVSLLLVIEDPDAKSSPEPFVHGIFYNLRRDMMELPERAIHRHRLTLEFFDLGVKMGLNSMSKDEYVPPSPPEGDGWHHYHFQLIALDTVLQFDKPATIAEVTKQIKDHVLAWGETVGMYKR